MSVSTRVNELIESLQAENNDVFPYLPNKNWKRGNPIYYSGPYWDNREISAAITALLSGEWLSAGSEVDKFEKRFSKRFGFKESVMVNSGSSANLVMIAALKKYYKWKDGDEIIVCACGFPTSFIAILQNGLMKIFVDIDFSDLYWDLE